uniref:Uncharacterized protein n=1 Tax=Romanomermis culicivorax TaxID=13658 RepID=A0A915IQW9_ROMCU
MMTLHNIAMLRLEKRVDFSSTIQPIQLANKFSDSSCSFTALEAHGSLAALTNLVELFKKCVFEM